MQPLLHLASKSPRRSELLTQIGVIHTIINVDIDETPHRGEQPEEYVVRLAQEKAIAGQAKLNTSNHSLVLAADTSVVVDGQILGKPQDRDDALNMMRLLSNRSHWVFSGIALAGDDVTSSVNASKVTFCDVTLEQATAYWNSTEPTDKAGGYGIQGLGSIFITRIEGSFSGVMGLPLFETAQLLMQAGIDPLTQSSR
jgi:nucleoside triphosphate pyrophosphatase